MSEINIEHLSAIEAIRLRTGMYIGDTTYASHLLTEVADNAIDEILEGGATVGKIYESNGFYVVTDNGRGIPSNPKMMDGHEVPACELAISQLHAGGKFSDATKGSTTGMNGIGITATNACSSRFIIYTKSMPDGSKSDTQYFVLEMTKGTKVYQGVHTPKELNAKYGIEFEPSITSTLVAFIPDSEIFENPICIYDTQHLKFVKFMCDRFKNKPCEFYLNGELQTPTYTPMKYESYTKIDGCDWYFTFKNNDKINEFAFTGSVNSRSVPEGIHIKWTNEAIAEVVYEEFGLTQEFASYLYGGHNLEVIIANPVVDYTSQTKTKVCKIGKLNASKVKEVIKPLIRKIIKANYDDFKLYVNRIKELHNASTKIATMQIVNEILSDSGKKSTRSGAKLAFGSKVTDASGAKRSETRLFITEGNSAQGSILKVRDARRDAVLPLRGRVLNTVGKSFEEITKNQEIRDLIAAIGCGVDSHHKDASESRYGAIIICTDADAAGQAIASSLISFFCDHMKFMIEAGKVFINLTPLYLLTDGSAVYPGESIPKGKTVKTRYKGLGEVNPPEVKRFILGEEAKMIRLTPDNYEAVLDLMGTTTAKKQMCIEDGILTDPYNVGY